jgi:L-iditol 2-dehydrogenase
MKAIARTEPGFGIRVTDTAIPQLRLGEVLVKIQAAGICGSDVHIYEWSSGYDFLIPNFPLTLGHEFVGEVIELCGDVPSEIRRGDKVTGEAGRSCGRCFFCKQGKSIICPERPSLKRIGLERNGAMAEYVAIPGECLHRIPPGVSTNEAALTEPAVVALGAVERAAFFPGETVVILGPGPIGLLILQICKALGAGSVLVFGHETDGDRLKIAQRLGADHALVSGREGVKKVLEITDGIGAAVAFEVSGSPAAAVLGLEMIRRAGKMVLVGIYPDFIPIEATRQVVRQMKTIEGTYGASSLDWARVLKLMAGGKLNLTPLISAVLPIEEAHQGFENLRSKKAMKVLLRPET